MADRIDIGAGPRLGFEPTDTSGFTFTPKEELTREQYLSQDVNFARQTLKPLTGLREETGIGVDAPEVGEDIDVTGSGDSGPETDLVDIYGTIFDNNLQEQTSKAQFGFEETGSSEYASYSDYLQTTGNVDRVNDVNNFYGPLANDVLGNLGKGKFGDITFENMDLFPEDANLGDRIEKTIKEQLTTKDLGKRAMSAAFSAVGGIFGGVMGSIIGGTESRDEFGDPSVRPSGALGALYDISMSRSYDIMNNIKAANSSTDPYESIGTFGQFGDAGFSAKLGGGRKILRDVGSRAYFKTGGLSFEQAKNIEAFSKGYVVNTYSFDQEGGTNIFGQQKNVKVEDIGGAFAGRDGYYTPDGKFYSTRYQTTSKYGPASGIGRLADQYGVTDAVALKAIEDARAGKGTVKGNIDAAIEKKRQDDLAAAEAERKRKEDEAKRQRQGTGGGRASDSSDQSYDSGGYSTGNFSGSGGRDTGGGGFTEGGFFSGLAAGGTVGMAAGGAMAAGMGSGFVDRPPSQVPEEQTVADDVETKMPEGAFVINAAAVEFAGEEDIKKMLNDAQKEAVRRGIAIDNSENSAKLIDVAISRGEVTVAPYLAKIIGYDRLNKINNRGKPETKERLQEAAQGGFLGLANGGTAEESSIQFGDTETGFDLLNRFNWNELLQESLRDINLTEQLQVNYPKMGELGGIYDPVSDTAYVGLHSDQLPGNDPRTFFKSPYSQTDVAAHELMHRGTSRLLKDNNFRKTLASILGTLDSYTGRDDRKGTAGDPLRGETAGHSHGVTAEHQYIYSITGNALLNSILKNTNDKNSDRYLMGLIYRQNDFMTDEQRQKLLDSDLIKSRGHNKIIISNKASVDELVKLAELSNRLLMQDTATQAFKSAVENNKASGGFINK